MIYRPAADDGIEADYAMGNVRVYENRIVDSFMGISSQPGIGGPTYFIRNVMYNVIYEAFKLHNGTVGDVFLHNTVVKSGDAFGCVHRRGCVPGLFEEQPVYRRARRDI